MWWTKLYYCAWVSTNLVIFIYDSFYGYTSLTAKQCFPCNKKWWFSYRNNLMGKFGTSMKVRNIKIYYVKT